ncbi:MAG: glycoside hydrolase family 3 N-terminal domain-containing protein [Bacteroidota bacterium]
MAHFAGNDYFPEKHRPTTGFYSKINSESALTLPALPDESSNAKPRPKFSLKKNADITPEGTANDNKFPASDFYRDSDTDPRSLIKRNHWVDSVFESMSPDRRIGQLFMVAAYSNRTEKHVHEIENLVRQYNLGGLIFFQGGPYRQVKLTNYYQSRAQVPLLIAMDIEWGLSMRLDSTFTFPRQMTLGALPSEEEIYRMGAEIASQCKRIGVQLSFSPVVDINSNPDNPVIGTRSFGESKENVTRKAIAYMKGLQDNGVMANLKHFPGHGDAGSDSHYSLPVINRTKKQLDEVELYPYKKLIREKPMSVMVAHLSVPAFDTVHNRATTLSHAVVTQLLKNDLGYEGLVFTDALNMKGVAAYLKPGELEVQALQAGNDMLLFPENVPEAYSAIRKAIETGQISQKEIDQRVRKILEAKFWAGLDKYRPLSTDNLFRDLHPVETENFLYEIFGKSATIVKNDYRHIPFQTLDTTRFVSVAINGDADNVFQQGLRNYAPFETYNLSDKSRTSDYDSVLVKLRGEKTVIVSFHRIISSASKNYGIPDSSLTFLNRLRNQNKVVVVTFGNPYSLRRFSDYASVLCMYEDNKYTQTTAPQVLFGALPARAALPVTADSLLPRSTGFPGSFLQRLRYANPEDVGMNGKALARIDSLAQSVVDSRTAPGCQVLVARDGAVVYNKSFGYQSYDRLEPVKQNTLYDIASVSKVAATLQVVMSLEEKGLLDITKKASYYLPELTETNKRDIVVSDLLLHQAGLVAFIPFWKRTKNAEGFNPTFICDTGDAWFNKQVAQGLYAEDGMEDTLWKWIQQSELLQKNSLGRYDMKYSDLGFYFLKRIVEKVTNRPLERYVDSTIYRPLGLATMTYRPLEKFPVERIAPTEDDKDFRGRLIRGTVHDPGAAMQGGVAGHAGLFSNANDLAILMQMHLNNGTYGGHRFLRAETVPYFTEKQPGKNIRGLGWDKPAGPGTEGPTSKYASRDSYGHTGFTGVCVWVDPIYNLIFVFLSNRIHPDAANTKLIKNSIRPRIHDMVYESIYANYPNISQVPSTPKSGK